MVYGSWFEVCALDMGRRAGGADLPVGSMSMSSLEPLLWVLLRLRNRSSFSMMNDGMGPREGRHASGDREHLHVRQLCFYHRTG